MTTATTACRRDLRSDAAMRCRRALTLVELLVVIGIIGLLIAILIPTLASARKLANRTACAANLSQIGQGLEMYANDWRGWPFPPAPAGRLGGRSIEWWKYTPGLEESYPDLRCPEDRGVERDPRISPKPVSHSYILNFHLALLEVKKSDSGFAGVPAALIVVMGEKEADEVMLYFNGAVHPYDELVDDRKHGEGSNYIFLDGHVAWKRPWKPLPGATDPWDLPIRPPTSQ